MVYTSHSQIIVLCSCLILYNVYRPPSKIFIQITEHIEEFAMEAENIELFIEEGLLDKHFASNINPSKRQQKSAGSIKH
jgi:hypothetical protein